MLVAKVAYEESQLKLESSSRKYGVAYKSLINMLDIETLPTNIDADLTTPFFICSTIPTLDYFILLAQENNHQTKLIEQQKYMATNSKKIAQSGYMPDISIFARQNIFSYNIPSNLLPRRMVGAAFAWNIFDGLNREKSIRTAQLQEESLKLQKIEVQNEIIRNIHRQRTSHRNHRQYQRRRTWKNADVKRSCAERSIHLQRLPFRHLQSYRLCAG